MFFRMSNNLLKIKSSEREPQVSPIRLRNGKKYISTQANPATTKTRSKATKTTSSSQSSSKDIPQCSQSLSSSLNTPNFTSHTISSFLTSIGMERYIDNFESQFIEYDQLVIYYNKIIKKTN